MATPGLTAAARTGLLRYWRTLKRFWGSALASQMEYQVNLLIEVLAMAGNLAGSLLLLWLIYGRGQQLGGWSLDAALVVLGIYTLLDGVSSTLLRPNLGAIVTQVQQGTLDFVLLKPIDSQFWLSTRTLSPWGLPEIVTGLGLAIWAALRAGARPGVATLLGGALMLLSSVVILYSLWFVLATTSIWFVKTWNVTEVLRAALSAGRYPISAYPAGLRTLFTVVLPVAFLTTVPAEAILGRASGMWLLLSVAVATASLLFSRWFWRLALRDYTSASS